MKWTGVKAGKSDSIWSVRSQLTCLPFQQALYSDYK